MDGEAMPVGPVGSHDVIETGEWAGWSLWSRDPFELHAGPFYTRREAGRPTICAFRAEAKHMNGGGFMHGGCLMTFADYALFALAGDVLEGRNCVTASLNGEFLDSALLGEMIEARGEVTKAGRSLVFIRGLISTSQRPLLTFSGIVKKVRDRNGHGTAGD